MDERRNILASIAQRRHGDDEGAEPKVEILTERPRVDRRPQVTVRRGDDSGVHLDVAFGADASDLSLLQGPQQFGLDRRSDFADLVQEYRAAAGDFEQTCLVAHGARKSASHVAEQLRFEQRFGQRRAVDAHERRSWRAGSDRGSSGR